MKPCWPIYVISLRGAAERRAQCAQTLARLGLRFEFFDAVEGAKLSAGEIARVYDAQKNARLYKHPLSRPEIGCWLSHYELWLKISASAEGGAFVLEDDFQAEPDLPLVLAAMSNANLKNCMVKLFSRKPVMGEDVGALTARYRLVMPRHIPGQTVGYAVDSVGAARLAAKAMPMGRPVDMDIKHWWEFGVPVLAVQPPPLKVDVRHTGSSIEAARAEKKPEGQAGPLHRAWRNLRYQVSYNAGALRHREPERKHLKRLQAALRSES